MNSIEQKLLEIKESNIYKRLNVVYNSFNCGNQIYKSVRIYFAGKLIGILNARSNEMMSLALVRWFRVMSSDERLVKLMEDTQQ